MKNYNSHRKKVIVSIKDIIMIILIIVPFTFIDLRTALFVGAICTSIFFMQGTIRYLKSMDINGYRILNEVNELSVPKGVEVFELAGNFPIEILYKYISVFRTLSIHPKILIIRFKRSSKIHKHEVRVLEKVAMALSERKIITDTNYFYRIEDTFNRAETIFKIQ